jgi:hypothetical protein
LLFALTFSFGVQRLLPRHTSAHFHIISKDTGFDPLLKYVKAKGIKIGRSKSIEDIPSLRKPKANPNPKQKQKPSSDNIKKIVTSLAAKGSGRPRKLKTLKNFVKSQSTNDLSDQELEKITNDLTKRGYISIEKGNVSYNLENPTKTQRPN